MEALIKSTTTTYETSDSDYILNFFNIPKLKTTNSSNHNNQLLGQTSPSLSGISENSNENFDGGGHNNNNNYNFTKRNRNNDNTNYQNNIQINSNSSSSSDIDDPDDDDSEQELTNLTWLTELRNQSLTWPESIKPIYDDDDNDDNNDETDYINDKDNNDKNNNRDKNTLIHLTGSNSLMKFKVNGQNKLNGVLNNCTTNNQVNVKKQTASERFNKFLDQIKKTRNDYDFSASTYQIDPNEKPPFNYSQIIGMAMLENGRMTLQQICTWIEGKFAYYRIRKNWNNSIRHNLSLQFCFRKIDRKKYEKGKGGYWELAMDIAKSERKRIRNRKTKKFTNNQNGRNDITNHQYNKNHFHQQRAPPQRIQNKQHQQTAIALSQIMENIAHDDPTANNNTPTTKNIILTIKENNLLNDKITENQFNEIISNNSENLNDLNLTERTLNELINKDNHTKEHLLHIQNDNTNNNNKHNDVNDNNYQNFRQKNQTIQMEINLDGELVPINHNSSNENCSQNIIKFKINDKLKDIHMTNNDKHSAQLEDIFMVANNKNNNNNNNNNINLNSNTQQIINFLNDEINIVHKNDRNSIILSSSKEHQQENHHQQEEIFEDEFQPGTIVDPTTMEIQQQLQQQIFLTNNNVIESTAQQEQLTSTENIVVSSFLNDSSPIIGPNVIVQQLPYYTIPVMDIITSTTETITNIKCCTCNENSNSNVCKNNCCQQHQNNINNNNNNDNCITDNDIDTDAINNDIIENQFRPYIDGIDEAFQFLRNSEHRNDEFLDGLYDISVGDF